MGQARKYILENNFVTTSGVTTVTGISTYNSTSAFSGTSIFDIGTTFSHDSVTLIGLSDLSNADYEQRTEDFLSYVSQFEYTYDVSGLTNLLLDSQFEEPLCLTPTTTTTTTTTTLAPTTTTTTTLAPTTTTTTTIPPVTASLFTLGTFGSDGSPESNKCTCIQYSPALGGSQTWSACVFWNLATSNDGTYGDGRACARVVCNTVNIHACNITSLGGGAPNTCAGSWLVTGIGSGDCVHLDVFSCADCGSPTGSGYGCSSMIIYDSVNNINGTVVLGSPVTIGACACDG